MVTDTLSTILSDLSQLLSDNLTPHSISYRFEKIALMLSKENLDIEKIDCKEYYEDGDLALILLMKNEALANAQFEQASKFHFLEKELLEEKGCTQLTELKIEPSYFDHRTGRILFHCNRRKENQRLIANLIEFYNLARAKSPSHTMASC